MLQSIILLGLLATVVIFAFDVRRKSQVHSHAVQKEREAILEQTHSTAILSSFSDGKSTEVLMGVSEDSGLFFYRRIDSGVMVLHYTVRIDNLIGAVLQVNGARFDFESESSHMTAQMRATEIAKNARLGAKQEFFTKIKHIRLNIFFLSADGKEKNIPVTVYTPPRRPHGQLLSKIFENSVWWQQYLSQLARRKSENDLVTFNS